MKKLKQIISQIQTNESYTTEEYKSLVWQYICYSPKMPARLQQQQLLDQSEKQTLKVTDPHFAKGELNFNTFKWGKGKKRVLITHGWGSKGIDFSDIITELISNDDFEIITFDAPGNGSSEGELSNLLLFVQAVKAVINHYGEPNILIGHSLGAMANALALKEMQIKVSVLISLTPLIKLKENFEMSMNAIGISRAAQTNFLESFEQMFGVPASKFEMSTCYDDKNQTTHWLGYDVNDQILPNSYLREFLASNPAIASKNYEDAGHYLIIKSPIVISDLVEIAI
jgi:pimeloyl-ACP methyl ester carboxylesterase